MTLRVVLAGLVALALTPAAATARQDCPTPSLEQIDFPGFTRDERETLSDSDTLHAFVARESGGRDFNGNGSFTDFVLKIYDTERGGLQPVTMGFGLQQNAQTLVVRDRLVAFYASESMQSVDLTGDGDLQDDRVAMIWDADRQILVNSQVVLPDVVPGSNYDPRLFIRGSRVVFTADEAATGRDLDGDGLIDTQVGYVYDASLGQLTSLGKLPLPIAVTNDTAWTLTPETVLGWDANLDGDLNDSVPQGVYLPTAQRFVLPYSSAPQIRGEGDYLALRVFEQDEGGADLNGNGATDDYLYMFWDTVRFRLVNPGLSQGLGTIPLLMNDEIALFSAWEGENDVDLNGDGDQFDAILVAQELATGTTRSLGVSNWSNALAGHHVVLLTREFAGHDYNGDGDFIDKVLHDFDVRSGVLRNHGLACQDTLRANGDWATATINEFADGRDHNGDGDLLDGVLVGLDLELGTVTDFGIASSDKCAPRAGRQIAHVNEVSEGRDLNGDGDVQDNVAHLFDLRVGAVTNLGLAATLEARWVGREAAAFVASEAAQGVDLNGDGDLLDEVTQIVHLPDLEWQLEGAPIRGGAPIRFRAYSSPEAIGDRSYLFLSLGDGQQSGGISLPGTSKKLALEAGPLFAFWLQLPATLREIDLVGCPGATTGAFQIPLQVPSGLRIHYAGLSIDGGVRISAVSDTQSFDVQ
ncbi:MAG: hypothetical protein RL885_01825 [Planctomycetota bacterium]